MIYLLAIPFIILISMVVEWVLSWLRLRNLERKLADHIAHSDEWHRALASGDPVLIDRATAEFGEYMERTK